MSIRQAWKPHLDIMADPDNYPMLVHCQHGVTRTSMFLTAYDVIYRHKTAEDSLAVQPTFGHVRGQRARAHLRPKLQKFANENRAKWPRSRNRACVR